MSKPRFQSKRFQIKHQKDTPLGNLITIRGNGKDCIVLKEKELIPFVLLLITNYLKNSC